MTFQNFYKTNKNLNFSKYVLVSWKLKKAKYSKSLKFSA
jgi:hypothetical protein